MTGRLRLVLAVAGFAFAVAGIATDNRLVVWVAIGLLGAAMVVRLIARRAEARREEQGGEPPDPPGPGSPPGP